MIMMAMLMMMMMTMMMPPHQQAVTFRGSSKKQTIHKYSYTFLQVQVCSESVCLCRRTLPPELFYHGSRLMGTVSIYFYIATVALCNLL